MLRHILLQVVLASNSHESRHERENTEGHVLSRRPSLLSSWMFLLCTIPEMIMNVDDLWKMELAIHCNDRWRTD